MVVDTISNFPVESAVNEEAIGYESGRFEGFTGHFAGC
jgi:hypothetical protein